MSNLDISASGPIFPVGVALPHQMKGNAGSKGIAATVQLSGGWILVGGLQGSQKRGWEELVQFHKLQGLELLQHL